jgi:hypothetical protein
MTVSSGGLRPRRARRQGGIDRDFGYDASNPYQGAFPNTPILDTFTTNPGQRVSTRDGWAATMFGTGTTGFAVNATPDRASSTQTNAGNAWGGPVYSDSEVYCTLLQWDAGNDSFSLGARIQGYTSPITQYQLILGDSLVATNLQLAKVIADTKTLLGVNTPTTFTPNDGYGLSVYGNVLTSWYRSGLAGAWVKKDSVVDNSITGPGGIGARSGGVSARAFTNFGGTGTPVIPARRLTAASVSGRRAWAGRS